MINPTYALSYLGERKTTYLKNGILVLENFLSPEAFSSIFTESVQLAPQRYRSTSQYNVYIKPNDPTFPPESPRNRVFRSSKGCICMDQLSEKSALLELYKNQEFLDIISYIVDAPKLYPYSDTLSGININYYDPSDSLEWHFDNADFTITLLVARPESGGIYQYVPNMRYLDSGNEDYDAVDMILDALSPPLEVDPNSGSLMVFRGNTSLHRVTEILSGQRILITLNYNREPNISLSEKSRMTFFGRLD